jgi:uncharacterized protein (TIGR02391 family)
MQPFVVGAFQMNQHLDVAIAIPKGRGVLSDQMRTAAATAVEYFQSLNSDITVEPEYIDEPCNSENQWQPEVTGANALVGPACSMHAAHILEEWPAGLHAAISPAADLPSLRELRRRNNLPFFRVCGDGLFYSWKVAECIRQLEPTNCPVVFDSSHRWWVEVGSLAASRLREFIRGDVTCVGLGESGDELQGVLHEPIDNAVLCYLAGSCPDDQIEHIVNWLTANSDARVFFPYALEARLKNRLAPHRRSTSGRVYTLRIQAPEISPLGHSHGRRLMGALERRQINREAAHMYDAVLVGLDASRRQIQEALPDTSLRVILEEMTLDGWTGTIQFSSHGDRLDQGHTYVAVWNGEQFSPRRDETDLLFDHLRLHPLVRSVSRDLFKGGHYASAVSEAFKAIDSEVQRVSGLSGGGTSMMGQAFNESDPMVVLNRLSNRSQRDEQAGFKHIFMGSMLGIRNLHAHERIQMDPHETLEYLGLASLLMRKLDQRVSPE